MKHLESSESTQRKSQNDRPSPEIPQECRANLRAPARVFDVEGDAASSKNGTFGRLSMKPRGPRVCGLLLRLWLLVAPYSLSC